jgi:hypothetical protein
MLDIRTLPRLPAVPRHNTVHAVYRLVPSPPAKTRISNRRNLYGRGSIPDAVREIRVMSMFFIAEFAALDDPALRIS